MNNIENITAVRDFMIKIGPEHFDMKMWFCDSYNDYDIDLADQIDINACGTTACIAGCAALVSGLRTREDVAQWLGLTKIDLDVIHLFHKLDWENLGPIGEEAKAMSDYDGALHLLNAAIEGRLVL